jgi:hypothetical protein
METAYTRAVDISKGHAPAPSHLPVCRPLYPLISAACLTERTHAKISFSLRKWIYSRLHTLSLSCASIFNTPKGRNAVYPANHSVLLRTDKPLLRWTTKLVYMEIISIVFHRTTSVPSIFGLMHIKRWRQPTHGRSISACAESLTCVPSTLSIYLWLHLLRTGSGQTTDKFQSPKLWRS